MIYLSPRPNRWFLYLIRPVRLSIHLRHKYLDVQSCWMSNWQMTHNNDIAYAPCDFNSTHWQLYCLLNRWFRQTWQKTSSRLFVRGFHRRWNRRTQSHQSSTPVTPCNGDLVVTSGFTAHRASNVINYGVTNYITVALSDIHEFSTHLHLHCLFDSLFGQTWKKTSKLRFFYEEGTLGTNGDTTNWASNAETFNQASTLHQQCEKH